MINFRRQQGQAIAEFNVTAAFVLVPLFIMIPVVGKYIDMKHSSVQTARYLAWERTVWTEPGLVTPDMNYVAIKDNAMLGKEAVERNLSSVAVDGLGDSTLNPLWHDRGASMLKSTDDVLVSYSNGGNEDVLSRKRNSTPSDDRQSRFYRVIEETTKGLGVAANATAVALSSVINKFNNELAKIPVKQRLPGIDRPNPVKDFQFKGYYRASVSMNINNDQFESLFKTQAVPVVSRASVLTDSWVTSDSAQFAERTDGLVPFSPFRKIFDPIRNALSAGPPTIALAPEFKNLKFGYVDTDPVTDSSVTLQKKDCPGGLCSYEN